MILRQGYAGPRPHAIARHPGQPGGAAAPAHTGPAGISPPHRPLLGVQLPQQPSQPRAGRANRRAQPGNNPGNPARSRRACHRSAPRDMTTQTGHSPLPAAWAGPREAPTPAALGTAGACHRRPAPWPAPLDPYFAGLLPQVAGLGPFLWLSCECPAGRPVW